MNLGSHVTGNSKFKFWCVFEIEFYVNYVY
jgi:hypothetical protein